MHAAGDERARRHGWEVIESTGRFGFGARTYRDPRFDDRRRQHSPTGSVQGQPQVRPRDIPRKTILQQREAEPAMNDRDAARTVSAVSFQLLYTADEAALMLRVKPRWLKRQAAARKVPFTMLAGSYRFSARHLEEITRMYEKSPESAGSSEVPRRRPHRHRAAVTVNGSDVPLRSRPPARRRARDVGTS